MARIRLKHADGKECECICRPCKEGLHGACLVVSLVHVCHCDCNWMPPIERISAHEFHPVSLTQTCKVCGLAKNHPVHYYQGFGDRMPGGWGVPEARPLHLGGHPITETTCDAPECWCHKEKRK
jgi:hypothetical protein